MAEPLSPAQAVLAAATQSQYELDPDDIPNEAARIASVIAPAIRALADQAGSARHWHVDQLRAIAAELEGGATTTSQGAAAMTTPIARCPGEGHWDGDQFHWMEGCDDCRRRTAVEGPVTVRPPQVITFECPYRIEPDA